MKIAKPFWYYVDKSGDCWEWLGGRGSKGYGQYRSRSAHVIAFKLLG